MNVRRKLALLLTAAVWSVVLVIPALMSAPVPIDPLAPIGPLAGFDFQPAPEQPFPLALQRQAGAALSELQAASTARTE
jgi:hypothetical protein